MSLNNFSRLIRLRPDLRESARKFSEFLEQYNASEIPLRDLLKFGKGFSQWEIFELFKALQQAGEISVTYHVLDNDGHIVEEVDSLDQVASSYEDRSGRYFEVVVPRNVDQCIHLENVGE